MACRARAADVPRPWAADRTRGALLLAFEEHSDSPERPRGFNRARIRVRVNDGSHSPRRRGHTVVSAGARPG